MELLNSNGSGLRTVQAQLNRLGSKQMKRILLAITAVIPGIAGVAIFGYFSLVDWAQLQISYEAFAASVRDSADLTTLFATEATQNIHRINLFADGVWTLLSAILAAIGLHSMCTITGHRK